MVPLNLSVHETVPIWEGQTPAEALRGTTAFAQAAERIGLHRFWVAEHHGVPALSSSSPGVLAAHLLANTTSIRVGSGSVLLPFHAPLAVAEQFSVLAALYPGRVDLGLGRGAGGTAETTALLGSAPPQAFPAQVAELLALLDAGPLSPLLVPHAEPAPEVWIHGSSVEGARRAAVAGLPFAYAELIAPGGASAALAAYREEFRPSAYLAHPHAAIAVNAVLAADSDIAWGRAAAFLVGQARLPRDPNARPPRLRDASSLPGLTAAERETVALKRRAVIIGNEASVYEQLAPLVESARPDELISLTQLPYLEDRIESYERLLAVLSRLPDETGLTARPVPTTIDS